jgi:hypothetical protein
MRQNERLILMEYVLDTHTHTIASGHAYIPTLSFILICYDLTPTLQTRNAIETTYK